jgi:hypothetical protein
MHSKQVLAVLALAASTATPVLSAPLPENQEQARAELEARLSLGPLLKTIGINAGIGAIPAILGSLTGGDDAAARELAAREELEARLSLGPILKTIGINAGIGAIPAILGSLTGGDDAAARELATREELEARLSLGPLLKTIGINAGIGAIPAVISSLTGGDDAAARELTAREELEARLSLGPLLKTIGINAGIGALPAIISSLTGGDDNAAAARELAAELDERGLGSLVGSAVKALENNDSIAKVLGTGLLGGVASGVASTATQDVIGGNNRREPEPLNLGALGKLLGTGLLGGVASGVGAVVSQDVLGNSRREPEPLSLGGIGKGLAGLVASLGGSEIASQVLGTGDNSQRDLTPEETIAALSLISKRSPEPLSLGGIGKGLVGLVASLGGSEIASQVLGTGDNSQRDLTPEETIAALSLISKRSPEPLNIGGIGKGLAGIVAGLAGSQIASGILGGSDNAQRDLTPEETLAALSLISKREISLDDFLPKPLLGPIGPVVVNPSSLNQLD